MLLNYTVRPCMTDKIITAFSRLIWDSDLVGSRFTLAMAEFLWAFLLFWPGNSFDRPIYTILKSIMCEDYWALIFLITASIQTGIILSNRLHNRFARSFAAFNAVLWLFVVGSMTVSLYPPATAAMAGEMAIAITATWICVRPYILARGYKKCL